MINKTSNLWLMACLFLFIAPDFIYSQNCNINTTPCSASAKTPDITYNVDESGDVQLIFTWPGATTFPAINSATSPNGTTIGTLTILKVSFSASSGGSQNGSEIIVYEDGGADDVEYGSGQYTYVTSFSSTYALVLNNPFVNFCANGSGTPNDKCQILQQALPLPIQLVSFEARRYELYNQLTWEVIDDGTDHKFIVEKSDDGINFANLETIEPSNNIVDDLKISYSIKDYSPFPTSFYRLLIIESEGTKDYSEINVVERPFNNTAQLQIFPNPSNRIINVHYNNSNSEKVDLKIYNSLGQTVYNEIFYSTPSELNKKLDLKDLNLNDQIYYVNVSTQEHSLTEILFLKR